MGDAEGDHCHPKQYENTEQQSFYNVFYHFISLLTDRAAAFSVNFPYNNHRREPLPGKPGSS